LTKIAQFYTHPVCLYEAPLGVTLSEFRTDNSSQKLDYWGSPGGKRISTTYLAVFSQYQRVTDVPVSGLPGCRCLRSSFTLQLHVPAALSHAASIFWNTLPDDVQSAPPVSSFRRQLKTFLFHGSPVTSGHFNVNFL